MTDGLKRYNAILPQKLYDELKATADRRHTTIVELLRQFIKLGLIVIALEDDPDARLIIRENGKEREVVIL